MDDDYVSTLGLAFTAHRMRRLSEVFVEATGEWLTIQGFVAPARSLSTLRLLLERESLSVTQLAGLLRLSHPFIVRLVSDLKRLRLVTVNRDQQDARRRVVRLSSKGLSEAQRLSGAAETLAAAYRSLAADAAVDLLSFLAAVEQAQRNCSLFDRLMQLPTSLKDGK